MNAAVLGIVGGIAPPSTIEYYRYLVSAHRARTGGAFPRVVINSIDPLRMLRLVDEGHYEVAAQWLADEVGRLARAGAGVALFASNTPHLMIDRIRELSPLPLISIVEATVSEVVRSRFARVGLVGTGFTMRGRIYQDALSAVGVEVFVPTDEEIDRLHRRYMGELVAGDMLPETRAAFVNAIERLRANHAIDAIILGGTELPILIPEPVDGVAKIDTTRVHVDRAIDFLLSTRSD